MEKCSFALHAWPGGKFNHLPFALNKNRTCKLEIFLDSMYSLAMGVSSDIVLDSETVQVDNSGVMYSLRGENNAKEDYEDGQKSLHVYRVKERPKRANEHHDDFSACHHGFPPRALGAKSEK